MGKKRVLDRSASRASGNSIDSLAGLWAMRILVNLGAWRNLDGIFEDNLLQTIGLPDLFDSGVEPKNCLAPLRAHQAGVENKGTGFPAVFRRNLNNLAKLLGLSRVEIQVLAFAVAVDRHSGLGEAGEKLRGLTADRVASSLAVILEVPAQDARAALSSKGLLARSGLLCNRAANTAPLHAHLSLFPGLSSSLFEQNIKPHEMLRAFFLKADAPELKPGNFHYMEEDYRILSRYLKVALEEGRPGVNILLHGAPGTGKSQLARVLARECRAKLFEINMCDLDGDSMPPFRRFGAYQLGQQVLARQSAAVLLFDEIEDVFPSRPVSPYGRSPSSEQNKAWINRQLEHNPVPTIWVSNSIRQMDRAYIRRFDFVFEVSTPPKKVRAAILKRHLQKVGVSKDWISRVAGNSRIAPGLITRAAKVATAVVDQPSDNIEETLDRVLANTLSAMGMGKVTSTDCESATPYRLDALNADRDIAGMVKGLKRHPHGRFCLYGPPGTGKTEFGRYIADELDRPLVVKRASDLLDQYVGGTEKRIAAMFAEARSEEAVLMLDEADSFLRDRSGAARSWEVTQVNELLTQMERFDGLFLCSTNLMDALDEASIRRFDFKIKFGYMTTEQSWILYREVLKQHGLALMAELGARERVSHLLNLTPGDFATVVRQSRLMEDGLTADGLLTGLEGESRFKVGTQSKGIGFTANI